MLLRGLRTPFQPPHMLNLRKVPHEGASRAAVAARSSCCFASLPDYDSSKLGQFFASDADGALRATQVLGTDVAAHSDGLTLVLANPAAWHTVTSPLLWPPRLRRGISAGPCKAPGCAGCVGSTGASRTPTAPEAVNHIFFLISAYAT